MNNERMIPPADATEGLSNLRRRLAAAKAREAGKVITQAEALDSESIRNDVAMGVVQGFELLMSDPKIMDNFWEHGYAALAKHSQRDAQSWIGKRIMTFLVLAVGGFCLVWLLRNGAGAR